MTIGMFLSHDNFQAVAAGMKTVEMRLYDEKRQRLRLGDTVIFEDIATAEVVETTVLEIEVYRDFAELFGHYDKEELGYAPGQAADPADMMMYYSEEKIARYGVCAIRIKLGKR